MAYLNNIILQYVILVRLLAIQNRINSVYKYTNDLLINNIARCYVPFVTDFLINLIYLPKNSN